MKRPKKKERPKFAQIPVNVLTSHKFIALPPHARVLYFSMAKHYRPAWTDERGNKHPTNNGRIWYGCREGAKAAGISFSWAAKLLRLIAESGAATVTNSTSFLKKDDPRPQQWELAIYPTHGRPAKWAPGDRHLRLFHWLTECSAYLALSSPAKVILWEVMRRFDGGNNANIEFGGIDGRYAGLSRDVTEGAITEIKAAGFIVETSPAQPRSKQARLWRLTMYPASGVPVTQDFMRAGRGSENPFHGEPHADDTGVTVNPMRITNPVSNCAPDPAAAGKRSETAAIQSNLSPSDNPRPVHRDRPDHPHPVHIRIEAISERDTGAAQSGARAKAREASKGGAGRDRETVVGTAEPLLFDHLPEAQSTKALDREQLRCAYNSVLAGAPRRTHGLIAETLGITSQTLSNWRHGKHGLSRKREAELRELLESEGWRDLISSKDGDHFAAA